MNKISQTLPLRNELRVTGVADRAPALSSAKDERKGRQGEGLETISLIQDLRKKEPRRWRRALCGERRGGSQHLLYLVLGETSAPRLDHDADDAPDHLPEEMGTGDPEDEQFPPGNEIRPVDPDFG